MLRTFVGGKIHQLKVTDLQPEYNGSCLIWPNLLAGAGIEPGPARTLSNLGNL
jgi:aspartate 1-decarboxylase